ncbi:MAG: polysaccharide deacetylase family protein [Spirochaetes bacterium]|nr:polysaccharide deacetylase family protein [Spirochaetota bacterium]
MKFLKKKLKMCESAFAVKILKYSVAGVLSAILLSGNCGRQTAEKIKYFEHIPVLCYHHINPSELLKDVFINTVPDDFEKQIQFLHSSGYMTILSKDIPDVLAPAKRNIIGKNKKPVLITFDDGYKSVYDYAYPIMKKYGYKGILFLISDKIENDRSRMYMNKIHISELIKEGWEIGSHTITHPKLNSISMEDITNEIADSKTALEKIFGIQIVSFAYPYGIFNKKVLNLVKDNYKYAYSTIQGNNYEFNDLHLIERYLVLKTDEMSNFKMHIMSKKLECRINSELYNNVLYVDVSFPQAARERPLQVYFNSRIIRELPAEDEYLQFKFNYYYEYNNFSIVMQNDAGEQCSITKMIHISKSAEVY